MAKREFSQDFTQKAGNTPLNFRMLVEDPASGTEYWVTMEQAQAILKGELNAETITRTQADTALAAAADMALVLGLD